MHVDVTVMEFTASILAGAGVGAFVVMIVAFFLTDDTDAHLIRALELAIERLTEKKDEQKDTEEET